MNFEISKKELYDVLSKVSKAVSSKNSLPILDCIYFSVKGGKLTVHAGSSWQRLSYTFSNINSDGEFDFCVNAKRLLTGLKNIEEQPIRFELEDLATMNVSFKSGSFKIAAEEHEDYPDWTNLYEYNTIRVLGSRLIKSIKCAVKGTKKDEIHPVFAGVYINVINDGKEADIVGTDGHILIKDTIAINDYGGNCETSSSFILMMDTANLLLQCERKDMDEDAVIDFNNRYVDIYIYGYIIRARLLEGRYPNYNSVFPEKFTSKAVIDKSAFSGGLAFVSSFGPNTKLFKMSFDNAKVSSLLEASDIDYNISSKTEIPLISCDGCLSIGLHSGNVEKALAAIDCESLAIDLIDPSRAIVIHPNIEEYSIKILLMPMLLE